MFVWVSAHLSLYLSVYWVLMLVSPFPPGAQLHVRSLVFLDQQVRLTGFCGGTGIKRGERGKKSQRFYLHSVIHPLRRNVCVCESGKPILMGTFEIILDLSPQSERMFMV